MIPFRDELDTAKSFLGIHEDGPNLLEKVRFGFVGGHENPAGENLGSLAILYCAVRTNRTVEQTLEMFGEYLESVNADPDGHDHPNIRALMKHSRKAYVGSFVYFVGDPIVSVKSIIEEAWERRADIAPGSANEKDRAAVSRVLSQLDRGVLRVASKDEAGDWQVHEWVKKAVLLSFRVNQNWVQGGRPNVYFDKVATKFNSWTEADFQQASFRVVPGAVARAGSYIGKGVILMPSFVNIGAYVDSGTMVDTWATVGSCAQIGKNVHLSGGVGIGGVLEPLQAKPTIIEDNCFIGARSEVVEGVIVGEGSVLGMGVFLGQSTPVWHREKRQWLDASAGLKIPPYSVVISGQKPAKNPDDPTTYAAVIVKTVDAQTRAKTSINDLLRD